MGFPWRSLLIATWAGARAAGSASLLAPEAFQSMANTSVAVLRTQRDYLREFADGQSAAAGHWFFYFDLRLALPETESARVRVPVNIGEMRGELRKGAMGFRLAYLQGDYVVGVYDVAEGFSVSAPRAWNPAYLRYYAKDSSAGDDLAWSQSYQNFAFTFERKERLPRRLAGLPGIRRGRLRLLLDLLGRSLDLLGMRKRWRWGEAELVPALNYFRYRRRFLAGAKTVHCVDDSRLRLSTPWMVKKPDTSFLAKSGAFTLARLLINHPDRKRIPEANMKPMNINPNLNIKLAGLALAGLLPLATQAHDGWDRRGPGANVSGEVEVTHEIPGGVITVGAVFGRQPQPQVVVVQDRRPDVVVVHDRRPDVVVVTKEHGRGW